MFNYDKDALFNCFSYFMSFSVIYNTEVILKVNWCISLKLQKSNTAQAKKAVPSLHVWLNLSKVMVTLNSLSFKHYTI